MKQMARVKTLDPHMGIAELKAFARQTGYSMFPVYDKRARKVMGIVSIYDLIFSSEDITDIKSIMRPVLEVSPYKPIDDFLREMRTKRQAMAIVRDDKGRHVGVVTLEDILEEIVGEFE